MMNMSESVNENRVMYREWFPAIMYNHHQTGPAGAVLFAPPFRDPFNYNFDPLIVLGIDMVGSAIHTRLAAEGKAGAVMRTGAPYSTGFNGGTRPTSYFHNQIRILTPTIAKPTPAAIPFRLELHRPRAPGGFIRPSDQPDFATATKFVNTLIKAGVVAHRATAPFTVAGKQYPAGSYVFKSAQAFRAHLLDMFEPQDHPDDIPYPGGAPRPPYDVTGYNLADSMGIVFDPILA